MSEQNIEEFSMVFDENMENVVSTTPASQDQSTPEKEKNVNNQEIDMEADIATQIESETATIDIDSDPNSQEIETEEADEDFKFDFDDKEEPTSEEPTKEEGSEKQGEISAEQEALEKRIAELENKLNEKTFEETYSKEKEVMPKITEYDYAMYGKEVMENGGKLTPESIEKLEALGYKKDVLDAHIKQTFEQNNIPEPTQETEEQQQNNAKNNFAQQMNISRSDFDNVLEEVVSKFTPEQTSKFNNLEPEEQVGLLQKFQSQKAAHLKRVEEKKIRKGGGNNKSNPPKQPEDSFTTEDLQAKMVYASKTGNRREVNFTL